MTRTEILHALRAPFGDDEIKAKPAVVKANRALAIFYLDARAVMDRLDDVLGLGNWATTYRSAGEGVVCSLSVRIEGEWITHEDFGGFSEQPDEGDKHKAAFSDALKRAAIHIGIGRYLYRLPQQWFDYDPQSRQFCKKPTLSATTVRNALHTPAQTPPVPVETPDRKPAEQSTPLLSLLVPTPAPATMPADPRKELEELIASKGLAVIARRTLDRLKALTIPENVALAHVGAKSVDDLDADRLFALRMAGRAIEKGQKKPAEVFPGLVVKKGGKQKPAQETADRRPATAEQTEELQEAADTLNLTRGQWQEGLRSVGCGDLKLLTRDQADTLLGKWRADLRSRETASETVAAEG